MSDITIIGGGIAGLLSAREFLISGATVSLFDRGMIGRESSWAGGGILLPLYPWRQHPAITTLCLSSIQDYPVLAKTIYSDTGVDPEWIQSGMLINDIPDIELILDWCEKQHIALNLLSSKEVQQLEPNITPPTDKVCALPDIAQIRNPRLIQALRIDLERRGARIIENQEIRRLIVKHDAATEIETCHGKHPVQHVVVTTGAWTGDLFNDRFPEISIKPVKGQMLLYKATPGLIKHIVLDNDRYLIPRKDGRILVGSTVEDTGFDKSTTRTAEKTLNEFALSTLPALAGFPIEKHWAGLRPSSPQGVPYIDNHPEIRNLSINAGHYRSGFVMGPASARLLVDLVQKKKPTLPATPYSLAANRHALPN